MKAIKFTKLTMLILCLVFLSLTLLAPLPNSVTVAGRLDASVELPIIMYHTIFHKTPGKYILPPSCLEGDLIYINQNGFTTVTVADLIDFTKNNKPLPSKPIMLIFDDGNVTNYKYAFPLLQKYNAKAVMAVVGAWIDENYDSTGKLVKKGPALNYAQIKEMTDSGLVEIQNHSYDMHKFTPRRGMTQKKTELPEEYEAALKKDLMLLQERLRDKVGIEPTAVAYPFGSYSKSSGQVLRNLGFKAAFTCNEKINILTRDSDLLWLGRFNRPYGISSQEFFAKIGLT